MDVCSPSAKKIFEKDNTCFSKEALMRLATLWNAHNPSGSPITSIASKSKYTLWNEINDRMKVPCNGSGREWCWIDTLGARSSPIVSKDVRPLRPGKWYKKPYTWLSNYDIAAVMKQYESEPSNNYKFLGVFPIDFNLKDKFGHCLYEEICMLDVTKFTRKGIKYIGLITNLDKHDEPGSHWTSTFICIDPNMECFGAYYYDSVSRVTPPDVETFINKVKTQLPSSTISFKMQYNKYQEQKENTECGMFSMLYQLRWLNALKKNPNATFADVMKLKMTDADVHKYRKVLFRENTTEVLKKEFRKSKTKSKTNSKSEI